MQAKSHILQCEKGNLEVESRTVPKAYYIYAHILPSILFLLMPKPYKSQDLKQLILACTEETWNTHL